MGEGEREVGPISRDSTWEVNGKYDDTCEEAYPKVWSGISRRHHVGGEWQKR